MIYVICARMVGPHLFVLLGMVMLKWWSCCLIPKHSWIIKLWYMWGLPSIPLFLFIPLSILKCARFFFFFFFLPALKQTGESALMRASQYGHIEVVKVLLRAKARTDLKTKVLKHTYIYIYRRQSKDRIINHSTIVFVYVKV
jgi:hypothetical protein